MDKENTVCIVTGASGGIGKAVCFCLAKLGMNLVLVAKTREKLNTLEKELSQFSTKVISVPTDLMIYDEIKRMVAITVEKYSKIDLLINCAFWGPPGSIEETTEEIWDKTLDTSLKGIFLLTREVVPYMKKQGAGRIINIGSRAGKVGEDNRSAYCAAKWGLEGLNAALEIELAPFNIHVHLVSPGATNTPFWPSVGAVLDEQAQSRFIQPEAIAEAVAFVIQQPNEVHIPDIPVFNFRKPFEGKQSSFSK